MMSATRRLLCPYPSIPFPWTGKRRNGSGMRVPRMVAVAWHVSPYPSIPFSWTGKRRNGSGMRVSRMVAVAPRYARPPLSARRD